MPITDPWFYLAAIPAVLVTGISKGGFGGGLGIVAVPLLALVIAPAQAVAIMLPILILMDGFGVHTYWREVDRGALAVMLPGAVVGITIGGLLFDLLDAQMMRLLVGVLAIGFVANYVVGGRSAQSAQLPRAWLGALCGGVAGFTSTIAHAGSPPAAISCRFDCIRRCSWPASSPASISLPRWCWRRWRRSRRLSAGALPTTHEGTMACVIGRGSGLAPARGKPAQPEEPAAWHHVDSVMRPGDIGRLTNPLRATREAR